MNIPTTTNLNPIVPSEYLHLHNDFTTLFNFVKIKYIRNVLRWNYDFSKSRLCMTKFNYDYANENECIPNFKKMQSEARIFESKYKHGIWDYKMENKYAHFLRVSIKEIINNLIVPVSDVRQDCIMIMKKYREDEYMYGPQFEDDDDEDEDDDEDDEEDDDKEDDDKEEEDKS